jgi:hypothetical protein
MCYVIYNCLANGTHILLFSSLPMLTFQLHRTTLAEQTYIFVLLDIPFHLSLCGFSGSPSSTNQPAVCVWPCCGALVNLFSPCNLRIEIKA